MGPAIAVARFAGAARRQSGDRPQEHQRSADPRFSKLTGSLIPDSFEFYWQPSPPVFDPAAARRLLAEAGHPNGFDAGEYSCDSSYSNLGEAVVNNLREVGIRAKLRPLERAAFFEAYGNKKLKNIIQSGSGAFATPRPPEAYVVKGALIRMAATPTSMSCSISRPPSWIRRSARRC